MAQLRIALNNLTAYEDALAALSSAFALIHSLLMFGATLGLLIFGLEDFDSAERAFVMPLLLDASHAPSHTNLGNALIKRLCSLRKHYCLLERGVELDQSSTHSLGTLHSLICCLAIT